LQSEGYTPTKGLHNIDKRATRLAILYFTELRGALTRQSGCSQANK
jgi:hypothetical protein